MFRWNLLYPLGSVGVKASIPQAGSFSSQLPRCVVFLWDATWELCRADNTVLCRLIFPGIFPWAWRAENMWRTRREDPQPCVFSWKAGSVPQQLMVIFSLYIFNNKTRTIKLIIFFLRMFLELLCIFCYCSVSVACFIAHGLFCSLYSLQVSRPVGLTALICSAAFDR